MRWAWLVWIFIFVTVTVTPAFAGRHDLFDTPAEATASAGGVAVLIAAETAATMGSASPFAPSFFSSVFAVALFWFTSDYVLVWLFPRDFPTTNMRHARGPAQIAVLFILSVIILMGVPVWGAKWLFLNSRRFAGRTPPYLTFRDALRSPLWLPPILVLLYASFAAYYGR